MLKVVAPALRQADPDAKILVGGLLLDTPNTTDPNLGKPELFLKGILEAGAGNSFDILAFHAYPFYDGTIDSDLGNSKWKDWGGVTLGKIAYIRQTLAAYGVGNMPLSLDEAALLYWTADGSEPADSAIPAEFLDAQASHLVRQISRSMSQGVQSYVWYTLHKSGWFSSGLLNTNYTPRPAYTAYQQLIKMAESRSAVSTSLYGNTVEAYRFAAGSPVVDVLWSKDAQIDIVDVPTTAFVAAYTRDGQTIQPVNTGERQKVEVGVTPVYIVRNVSSVSIPSEDYFCPEPCQKFVAF
jgi:hypothetical protein